MGIFNRFTRSEHMNMKTGKFERAQPKELTYEEQMNTPEHRRQQKKQYRLETRRLEREAYRKAYRKARIERATKRGKTYGGSTWFERMASPPPIQQTYYGYPKKKKKKTSKKRRRKPPTGNYGFNFDPIDNWRF